MDREQFLDNIASRLGRERITDPPQQEIRGVANRYRNSPYGEASDGVDRLARFKSEVELVAGHVEIAESVAYAGEILRRLIDELAAATIITWDRAEFAGWGIDWLWADRDAISFSSSAPHSAEILRAIALKADIGVTLADFAVANTGSLILATTPARNRSVSLLPTVHITLIHEHQIVDRLGEALEAFSQRSVSDIPSSLHIITGPSRSADIENDLSIGVHGPAALYVIVASS